MKAMFSKGKKQRTLLWRRLLVGTRQFSSVVRSNGPAGSTAVLAGWFERSTLCKTARQLATNNVLPKSDNEKGDIGNYFGGSYSAGSQPPGGYRSNRLESVSWPNSAVETHLLLDEVPVVYIS